MSQQQRNKLFHRPLEEYPFIRKELKNIEGYLENFKVDKKEKTSFIKETKMLIRLAEMLEKIIRFKTEKEIIDLVRERLHFIGMTLSSDELKKKSKTMDKKWKKSHDALLKTIDQYMSTKKQFLSLTK